MLETAFESRSPYIPCWKENASLTHWCQLKCHPCTDGQVEHYQRERLWSDTVSGQSPEVRQGDRKLKSMKCLDQKSKKTTEDQKLGFDV